MGGRGGERGKRKEREGTRKQEKRRENVELEVKSGHVWGGGARQRVVSR